MDFKSSNDDISILVNTINDEFKDFIDDDRYSIYI